MEKKKIVIPAVAGAAATALLAVAAVSSGHEQAQKAKAGTALACVLLPDTKSSVRWETQDRRFLASAFKAAGVSYPDLLQRILNLGLRQPRPE